MIKLVQDTIDKQDINSLIDWLKTDPQLTKGSLTVEFEKKWSEYLGCKHSVFINSGSSANLAMFYSIILSNRLRNRKVIVPAVSWVTTVTPVIQFGLEPIMCDCDPDNLGLEIESLKKLIEVHQPSVLILVHVLGVPNHMDQIIQICQENDIIILEDTCESIGSEYRSKKLGTFGLMSSFSFYFGHHMSTIEGGMICTDDDELYYILLSIRSHGWDRDLPTHKQKELRKKYDINDFRALYTFYYPGFNLRSTDLQAFIGLGQLEKIESIVKSRNENFEIYNSLVDDRIWKINPPQHSFVSNFAYPIITENLEPLIQELNENQIESRPLICGSMNEQPFWYESYGKSSLPNALRVHRYGLYLPNHPKLVKEDIVKITNIINKFA